MADVGSTTVGNMVIKLLQAKLNQPEIRMKPHINPGKDMNEENDLSSHRPGEVFGDDTRHRAHHPWTSHGHWKGQQLEQRCHRRECKGGEAGHGTHALETCGLRETRTCNKCQDPKLTRTSAEGLGQQEVCSSVVKMQGSAATLADSLTVSYKTKSSSHITWQLCSLGFAHMC